MSPHLAGSRGALRIDSSVNVIVDGNSIYANSYTPIATLLASHDGIGGRGASTSNVAIGGDTWSAMAGQAAAVSSAYVDGKTNVLVCGETTNSIATGGGRTAAQAWSDCVAYLAAMKAAKPALRIVLCGSLPCRYLGDGSKNAAMLAWDALALASYKSAGAERFVDYRNSVPFNVSGESSVDYDLAYFDADTVHVKDAGKLVMCGLIVLAIKSFVA